MRENVDQNNSEYGNFLRTAGYDLNSANVALKSYFQIRKMRYLLLGQYRF